MRSRLTPLLLAAALFAATPARAQTTFTFVSGGSTSAFGYQVGPHTGIQGTGATAQSVFLYCVDFAHQITPGQVWDANVTSLAGGSLTSTRSTDLARYQQAAWLSTQFALHPEATPSIQAALWSLFQTTTAEVDAAAAEWRSLALANYGTMEYGSFYVVTDINAAAPNSAQEFIISATPEPATLMLLATGLILVLGAARRKRSA